MEIVLKTVLRNGLSPFDDSKKKIDLIITISAYYSKAIKATSLLT